MTFNLAELSICDPVWQKGLIAGKYMYLLDSISAHAVTIHVSFSKISVTFCINNRKLTFTCTRRHVILLVSLLFSSLILIFSFLFTFYGYWIQKKVFPTSLWGFSCKQVHYKSSLVFVELCLAEGHIQICIKYNY